MKILSYLLILAFAGCTTAGSTKSTDPIPPRLSLDLQELIEKTPDGGTVNIPYGEFILEQELRIENKDKLTLSSSPGTRIFVNDVNKAVLKIRNCQDITVLNLHLRHVNPLKEYECHGPVIRADNVKSLKVTNCELDGCGAVGLSVWNSGNIEVKNCFVHHNTFNAFYFSKCSAVRIHSSIIENNKNLMQTYKTGDIEMSDNLIRSNGGYWGKKDSNPGLLK